jgi:ABC-type transport system involved in multi-copper enzyme maturation permease subunit
MKQQALHVWMLARLTLREAWRRRLFWIAGGMGLTFLALFGFGFWAAHRDMVKSMDPDGAIAQGIFNSFMLAGLYAVNFLIVMTTVLTAVGSISQEVSTNTIHTLAAKPMRRWQIFLGKWVGHALMLTGYVLMMVVSIFLITFFITGYVAPHPLEGLALLLLEGLVLLSVTMLGSTLLSTLANGVLVFMLYGVAFIGAWTEQIGSLLESRLAVDLGIISSLLLPSEALWRRAAYTMQSNLTRTFNAAGPFGGSSVPSDWFIAYAGVYVLVMVTIAMRAFARRDL